MTGAAAAPPHQALSETQLLWYVMQLEIGDYAAATTPSIRRMPGNFERTICEPLRPRRGRAIGRGHQVAPGLQGLAFAS